MKSLTHALSCNSSSISTPQNAITRCLCSSPFIASIVSSTLALAPHAHADENAADGGVIPPSPPLLCGEYADAQPQEHLDQHGRQCQLEGPWRFGSEELHDGFAITI